MTRLITGLLALVAAATPVSTKPHPIGSAEFYWLMDRACVYGDEFSVQILLKAGADPSGPKDYGSFLKKYGSGLEPSWHVPQAAWGGFTEIARLLLEAGADPNLVEGGGYTALTIAAQKGHLEIVKLLLAAGADKDYIGAEGTAAEIAARNGFTEIAELIRGHKR